MAETPSIVTDFWQAFGDASIFTEIEYRGPDGSIAADVVSKFNLPLAPGSSSIGGNLSNLDLKQVDALSAINMSLLEESCKYYSNTFYEVTVNASGEVEFIEIGGTLADLSDVYYQVQSAAYKFNCVGVMVTGGKPFPERRVMNWKPIWQNKAGEDTRVIMDVSTMVTNCTSPNYSTHAMILFDNPHLANSEYNDGIDNLYDITSPFETILGYSYIIDAPNKTVDTKVSYRETDTIVPIQLGTGVGNPNMGTLMSRPKLEDGGDYTADCWKFADGSTMGSAATAIKVDISDKLRYETIRGTKVDKFVSIEQVVIIGYELDWINVGMRNGYTGTSSLAEESALLRISSKNTSLNTYQLELGKHYTVLYLNSDTDPEGPKEPYIQFAKDTHTNDVLSYGNNTPFRLRPGCSLARILDSGENVGTIFPCSGNRGYLVEQIWVMAKFDTPSILVFDPEFNESNEQSSKASDIANQLVYYIAPIILYDPPPPIAFKGEIIDQTANAPDKDPTTIQDFEDTPLELALEEMAQGLSVSVNLSHITDEETLKKLSLNIQNIINSDDGVETTYVCGPLARPVLGAMTPDGGVINNITYSYSDSGSYTISVNSGAKFLGMQAITGGPSFKATESLTCRGRIIQDLGNHIHYKVKLDGFEDRIAINTSPSILRVGDIVLCSVHNNPVEE